MKGNMYQSIAKRHDTAAEARGTSRVLGEGVGLALRRDWVWLDCVTHRRLEESEGKRNNSDT